MTKKKLTPGSIRAEFQRSTFDAEKRTIEVICTTDAPVVRWGWDGQYNEVLSMEPGHVRMERFTSGAAPLLNSHNRWELNDVIGVIERAWLEGNKLMAVVRFSDRDNVKDIIKDVADGILKSLSIGYKILKVEETKAESGQLPVYRVTDWEPYEVSFVAVPADPNATVRSDGPEANEIEFISANREIENNPENNIPVHKKEENMPTEEEKRAAEAAEQKKISEAAQLAERARAKDIRDAVKTFGLEDSIAERLIDAGVSVEAARAEIQVEFAKKDPNAGASNVQVKRDEADTEREAIQAGMLLRSGAVEHKDLTPKEREIGNPFRSLTLLELAKERLEKAGVNTKGMSKMEIAKRAITSSSSDFPVLLEGTNRRVLLANYNAVSDTWRRFCATGSVSDFREHKRLRLGSLSNLELLGENSEYKNKKLNDATAEKISAKTKGNIINISRTMIINDDLSGFTRLSADLGRAAARSIESDVYALLESNPTLEDGIALFHDNHFNLVDTGDTGVGGPTVTNIDTMRQLMAKQKEPSGNDFLDIRPRTLLVPISLGGAAKIVNGSQYDPDASNKLQRPNIVAGLFSEVIDTPRLTSTVYYAFADPSEEPVIEVVFLDGVQTPYMESQESFNVDGISWKVRLDYGVGAVGFRGAVKNQGA